MTVVTLYPPDNRGYKSSPHEILEPAVPLIFFEKWQSNSGQCRLCGRFWNKLNTGPRHCHRNQFEYIPPECWS
jgi:hypothetical protein